MAASSSTVIKRCVACGKDVTTAKRMKDSQGRYWCVDCGVADQRKKGLAGGGDACTGCGQHFPSGQLSRWGGSMLCAACVKRREKGPSLMDRLRLGGGAKAQSSGESSKGRLIGMIALMSVLFLIVLYIYL
jgi:hypothetical protein